MYGLGDITRPGLTTTGNMGGITTGVREARQIDYVNPAGASARDSLTFMLDFGGEMRNFYSGTASQSTSYNTANFHHLAFAFPIRRLGVSFGIMPFSSVGYEFERREQNDFLVANMGDVRYLYRGENGINQIFLNLGYNISQHFSAGVGVRYYFGSVSHYYNVQQNTNAYYADIRSSKTQKISDFAPVLGIQYAQPLSGNRSIALGASWQPEVSLSGTQSTFSQIAGADNMPDTAYSSSVASSVKLPMLLTLGASITASEKWMLGAEFSYQDWSKTTVMNNPNELGRSYSAGLGGYYIPNRYDVRYFWKRMTYRGGLRYSQTPFLHNGYAVGDMSLNVGVSVPMRGAGYLNAGVEVGRRGTTDHGMVQETYVNFSLGITLFELWFVKYKYE
jgi:hypothetical protein